MVRFYQSVRLFVTLDYFFSNYIKAIDINFGLLIHIIATVYNIK